jgi:hypothetical protein
MLFENDYYWLHSNIDEQFWIIPESELFTRKLISTKEETIYNNIDKERIIQLFE